VELQHCATRRHILCLSDDEEVLEAAAFVARIDEPSSEGGFNDGNTWSRYADLVLEESALVGGIDRYFNHPGVSGAEPRKDVLG
jgi:hypothetical protein